MDDGVDIEYSSSTSSNNGQYSSRAQLVSMVGNKYVGTPQRLTSMDCDSLNDIVVSEII